MGNEVDGSATDNIGDSAGEMGLGLDSEQVSGGVQFGHPELGITLSISVRTSVSRWTDAKGRC